MGRVGPEGEGRARVAAAAREAALKSTGTHSVSVLTGLPERV